MQLLTLIPCRHNRLLAQILMFALCICGACAPQMQSTNGARPSLPASTPFLNAATSTPMPKPSDSNTPLKTLTGEPASFQAEKLSGTYKLVADNKQRKNTIKVLAVSHNQLKIKFEGLWEYTYKGDPIANVGQAEGVVLLEGDSAVLKPENNSSCSINFKFLPASKLIVESDCEFGRHVNASGQYIRRSKKLPAFDETD